MPRLMAGAFMMFHGLAHLLYLGQAMRFSVLRPGMAWPDGTWAFFGLLGEGGARWPAGIACLLAALAFVAASAGFLARQSWWRPVLVGAAVFSAVIFILFWNGRLEHLADQGAIAILVDLAILFAVLGPGRSKLGF